MCRVSHITKTYQAELIRQNEVDTYNDKITLIQSYLFDHFKW